jgi:uncharacterized protein YjdB
MKKSIKLIICALMCFSIITIPINNSSVCAEEDNVSLIEETKVEIDKTEIQLNVNNSAKLSATVIPNNASCKTVTWSSSNNEVATVSSDGVVTAINGGTATITATSVNGKVATCEVTVVIPVTGVTLNKSSLSLEKGKTVTLKTTVIPSNANNSNIKWESSNKKIVTVDQNGKVTAISVGKASITAKTEDGNKIATCKVTVPEVKITSVKLDKKTVSLFIGESSTVKATINPSNTTQSKTIVWSTSNKKVATVNNGKIKAVGVGTATITAKSSNGKTVTCKVTVKKKTFETMSPTLKQTSNVTKNSIKIVWTKYSGAQGYYIYRKSGNGSWKKIGTVKGGSTLNYTDKTAKGTYKYAIKAYKVSKKKTIVSSLSTYIEAKILKSPTIKVVRNGDLFQDKITWNKISGATQYEIYRKNKSNGTWTKVDTTTKTSYIASVGHGYYVYWKVRPIYKGTQGKSVGAFSEEENLIIYYNPDYSVFMSSKTKKSTAMGMIVTNNGKATMRIYTKDAKLIDYDYTSFNRNLQLTKISDDGNSLINLEYQDIKPGESAYVGFTTLGGSTWYDKKSTIRYRFRYDGINYIGYSSSYFGTQHYE